MSRLIFISLAVLFVFSEAAAAQESFSKYRKIDAFEVKPGVLMMPRYSADNEVCEIALEEVRYSPTLIRLDPDLFSADIVKAINELVPASERGKLLKPDESLITQMGGEPTETTRTEYENVLVRLYAMPVSSGRKRSRMSTVVATVTWNHRTCV